ncbi:hypothetical protein [Aestuariibacter salexigens]|uniref:hypothetical protein n=1 Tax=Aestuariibacter salexigens TaxID=226010 RepID=UPI000409C787|nr:hypothetical protein [Aestuariibacter salexigens]
MKEINRLLAETSKSYFIDEMEKKLVAEVTKEFHQALERHPDEHSLYALTLTANESFVHKEGIWFDDDARNELCSDYYSSFIHRLSSYICPNYKRNTYDKQRIKSWGVIEHMSREVRELCVPHIHATLAIHHDWQDKFLSCFEAESSGDFLLPTCAFREKCLTSLNNVIGSVCIRKITDEYRWSSYCLKQVQLGSNDSQEALTALVFNHPGRKTKLTGGASNNAAYKTCSATKTEVA